MDQIPIKIIPEMLANVLEGVGVNYVVFLIIANNDIRNILVASVIPDFAQLPCW